jgi:hypothetical protein
MRSIGRINITLVISETKSVMEKEKKYHLSPEDITTTVINRLPNSLWENDADRVDREVKNIIYDTINGRR